jgi:hypothetical protein
MDVWVFIPLLNGVRGMSDLPENKPKGGSEETDERGRPPRLRPFHSIQVDFTEMHRWDDKDTYWKWWITSLAEWRPSSSQLPQQGTASK